MRPDRSIEPTIRRGVAVVAGLTLIASLMGLSPASAGKTLTKKSALKLFYTEGEADALFLGANAKAADSDKLDGTDGSQYATDSEVVPNVLAGDGSGSGLDADTVDGYDAENQNCLSSDVIPVTDDDGRLGADCVDAESIVDSIRTLTVPAQELDEAFTGGIFPQKVLVGDAPALAFDPTTDEAVNFTIPVPGNTSDFGNLELRLIWSAATTGGVRWEADVRMVGANDSVTSGGFSSTLAATGPASSTSQGRVTQQNFGIFGGAALDDYELIIVELRRDPDHGGDTVAGDANLYAVQLDYNAQS